MFNNKKLTAHFNTLVHMSETVILNGEVFALLTWLAAGSPTAASIT